MNTPTINNLDELKRILEAALLAADAPLSLREMKRMFEQELSEDMLRRALDELKSDWEGKAIELVQVAEGWRFQTRPEMQPYLARMRNEKPPRYSRAVLETLAIIAYRQPVTAPEISDLRGVNSTAVIRTLLERRMIRVAGRKEVVGSPFLYRTTREFLVHFGLNDIRDLPRLEEFGDLIGESINEDVVAAINAAPEPDYASVSEETAVELESTPSDQRHE